MIAITFQTNLTKQEILTIVEQHTNQYRFMELSTGSQIYSKYIGERLYLVNVDTYRESRIYFPFKAKIIEKDGSTAIRGGFRYPVNKFLFLSVWVAIGWCFMLAFAFYNHVLNFSNQKILLSALSIWTVIVLVSPMVSDLLFGRKRRSTVIEFIKIHLHGERIS